LITGGFSVVSNEVFTVNFRGRLFCKGYDNTVDILSTDGTAATLAAFTGPGGDDKDLWRITTYKGRLYGLTISDASMWYGGVDAVTGAMTQFDFQSILTRGGKPWYIGSFSMTGGDITQEYFVLISEQGETLLYQGDYPGSATWGLMGRYFLPAPVGRNSFFNWGSDILIVTYEGLASLRDYIGTSPREPYTFLSDNIASSFKDAVAAVVAVSASQVHFVMGIVYPKGQYLLVSFYGSSNVATQYVMNTQTRAWTKFTNQRGLAWSLLNNSLYFGSINDASDGFVAKADNGYFDEDLSTPAAVIPRTIKLRHAFNYLGERSLEKQFTEAILIIYQSEGLDLTLDADVDYANTTATSRVTDTTDTSYKLYQPTMGLKGSGKAVSIRIDGTVTTKRMSLQATEVRWKEGDL
jgi:hypothetical protein